MTEPFRLDKGWEKGAEIPVRFDPDTGCPTNFRKVSGLFSFHRKLSHWRKAGLDEAARRSREELAVERDDGSSPACDLEVVAIPEPGKFRVITLGRGRLYTAIQPLQGAMLKAWKSRRESTMLKDDLTSSVVGMDRALPELPLFCSVDYEAATDLIKKDATMLAFEACSHYPFFDLGLLSLGPGRAVYPDGRSVNVVDAQPMGHPLSFPLLCVINLAVYRESLRIWFAMTRERRFEAGEEYEDFLPELVDLRDRMATQVLVNGDDMLFKCDSTFYEIFVAVAENAGLMMSVGKQYLSPDMCMINSQVFQRTSAGMVRRGYLNLNLVMGKTVKTGESNATPVQIGRELSRMVRLCPWAASAIPHAFSKWGQDWLGKNYFPNWYVPPSLGGFGVDLLFAPSSWRMTQNQRVLATQFVNTPALALYRRTGQTVVSVKLATAVANWKVERGPELPVNLSADRYPNTRAMILASQSAERIPQDGDELSSLGSAPDAHAILHAYVTGEQIPRSEVDLVPDSGSEEEDAWLERFAYASRALGAGPTSDKVAFDKLKEPMFRPADIHLAHRYRSKPMNLQTISEFWGGKVSCSALPFCPPLPPLVEVYSRHIRVVRSARSIHPGWWYQHGESVDVDGREIFPPVLRQVVESSSREVVTWVPAPRLVGIHYNPGPALLSEARLERFWFVVRLRRREQLDYLTALLLSEPEVLRMFVFVLAQVQFDAEIPWSYALAEFSYNLELVSPYAY